MNLPDMSAHTASVRTFAEWRAAARPWLAAGTPPHAIEWTSPTSLFAAAAPAPAPPDAASDARGRARAPRLPAAAMRLLETLTLYRDEGRWTLMYRLAWRLLNENPRLLEDAADPDVHRAARMESAIRRDVHKMHAYVRFREVVEADGERVYFAWFEPAHEILPRAAPFFVKRFANMPWSIATPDGSAVWRDGALTLLAAPAAAPRDPADPLEDLWRTYYRSICNVARLNPRAMQREMPQRYWRHLPEAGEIASLLREGTQRLAATPARRPAGVSKTTPSR